jgi:tRNA(Ile)-lysidine synthase
LPAVIERKRAADPTGQPSGSLEMRARKIRHEFLARTASRLGIQTIALGHHADDQVELFFLRLLRGSGGEGLSGMRPKGISPSNRAIRLVRPLLEIPRAQLSEFASEHGIAFREDESNKLVDIPRNRIRHELLPLIRAKYQPAINLIIPRILAIVRSETDLIGHLAIDWLQRRGVYAAFDFSDLPVAIQRKCVQLQLRRLDVEEEFELIEFLRLNPNRPQNAAKLGGVAVVRDPDGRVRVVPQIRQSTSGLGMKMVVEFGGTSGKVQFGDAEVSWRIQSIRGSKLPKKQSCQECFDAGLVGDKIILRNWQPGDRFQPIGMSNPVKLQDFFTNEKVPRAERSRRLLATTSSGVIFWVEGMRIAEQFRLTKRTNRRLQWRWKRL